MIIRQTDDKTRRVHELETAVEVVQQVVPRRQKRVGHHIATVSLKDANEGRVDKLADLQVSERARRLEKR